jgi:phage FluMu gp28-like protein
MTTPPPAVLLSYQQQLLASVSHHAVTVVEKSRRTGYSWAISFEAVTTAALRRDAGGMDVYYMGYNLEMAREFIGYCGEHAKALGQAITTRDDYLFPDPDKPEKFIKAFRVTFASGFEIVALPSAPRSLRGMQGLVIIDEAAFHDDLDELLKAAFALLIWGGKVVVISTHNGDTNPFNVLVQDIRSSRKNYHLLRCTFDDALAQGLYQRICLKLGQPWTAAAEAEWAAGIRKFYGSGADEELDCIPSPSTGAAIPSPLIEARMEAGIPVLRWQCPAAFTLWAEHLRTAEAMTWCETHLAPVLATLDPERAHVLGEDFGRTVDLTVFWPLSIEKSLMRRTPFVVELRGVPFDQQRQVLFYILDRLPRRRAVKLDARGNGQYLAEVTVQKYGAQVEAVMLSEPWYRENMPPLKAAFEDGTIAIPKDADIMDDLRALAMVRGVIRVPERSQGSDGGKRHGDAAVALALAYAASRAEPEEYGYQGGRPKEAPDEARGWGADDDDNAGGNNWARQLRSIH